MLEWLEHVACTWPSDFSILAFDPKHYDVQEDYYNDDQGIRRRCFDEVERGCSVYLNLALDNSTLESLSVVMHAISLLSRFPSFKEKSLPELRDMYTKSENQNIRVSAIMAISHLATEDKEESAKLRESLLAKCQGKSEKLDSLGNGELLEVCMEAIALGRLYVQVKEVLPQCVKSIIFHVLAHPVRGVNTAFGGVSNITDNFIAATGDQFSDEMIAKLSNDSQMSEDALLTLIKSLLAATFQRQSGYGSSSSEPPPFFNLKINTKQAKVLQALVDCDPLWALPEPPVNNLMFKLHRLLQIAHNPTRETLQLSLEKYRQKRENGEIGENGENIENGADDENDENDENGSIK